MVVPNYGKLKAFYFLFHTVNYTANYTIINESPLASWDGPPAALYYNFDTLTGLALMAGSGTSNYDPLVPGKVNRSDLLRRGKSICLELFY